MQFCMENLQIKRKKTTKFDLPERGFEHQIFSNFRALDLNLRVTRSNPGNFLKEIGLYLIISYLNIGDKDKRKKGKFVSNAEILNFS